MHETATRCISKVTLHSSGRNSATLEKIMAVSERQKICSEGAKKDDDIIAALDIAHSAYTIDTTTPTLNKEQNMAETQMQLHLGRCPGLPGPQVKMAMHLARKCS